MRTVIGFAVILALVPFSLGYMPAYADDGVFISRMMAIVFPDVSRFICKEQEQEQKEKLEYLLEDSGLLTLSFEDVCLGDICKTETGTANGDIKIAVDSFRQSLIDLNSKQSFAEREKQCKDLIVKYAEMEGGKGKTKMRIFENFNNVFL